MNLLITGAWQEAGQYIDIIQNSGHAVEFLQYEKDKLPCEYEWVEGIVGNGIFLTHPIEKFINLKYIQLTSAGYDRVPMEYVIERGIKINNARGVYSIPMAEYAIAGALDFYKNQKFFWENQKKHSWEKQRSLKELNGQNVCILGCGSVGEECAKRFQAFDCVIRGIDVIEREQRYFSHVYSLDDVKNILSESDIVIVTLPLTEATYHMFDVEMFKAMKEGTLLINIARGALIDTDALEEALKDRLMGAVLDVFEEEPLPENHRLWDMENIIITPHNSFVGNGNNQRMSNVIMKNLENY